MGSSCGCSIVQFRELEERRGIKRERQVRDEGVRFWMRVNSLTNEEME